MHAAAASSHVWISCANTSARESLWPAFFVRADGVVTGRLRRNVAGVLITEVDTKAPLYDSIRGQGCHSTRTPADRSEQRP